jgi:phosphoglycolate phosphatase-like HAD superfamily hydrolase
MSLSRTDAVVFDFDGVLAESTDVKTQAFATLYGAFGREVAAQAVAYHVEHAGISRFAKFRHLHRTLLRKELSGAEVEALGAQFSRLVVDAVVAAPWVAGAREFVEAHYRRLALFIASGTPEEELRLVAARRGMAPFFRSIRGVPATKGEIIRSILGEYRLQPGRVLMVGDARADYDGAREAGARFVGRVHSGLQPFPPEVSVIPDLTTLADFA